MCKVEKILNTLINNSIFIELKNNFLLNTNIKNFKLLIIFFKEYISDTIGKFKYSLNYNLNLSITNAIGEPIFFNYLRFNTLNVFKNSFNDIYNNEINLLSLFNLYVDKLNNFSIIEQIIVNKTISKKNKKWRKINNFYLRYIHSGTVTLYYSTGYNNAKIIYDFNLKDINQQGEVSFPYIPDKYTTFSCDFYGNFYIFDKTQTTINILNRQLPINIDGSYTYFWGIIDTKNLQIYGCTGLYTSIKNTDGSYTYYGFYSISQKDSNGIQTIAYYMTTPIKQCGDIVNCIVYINKNAIQDTSDIYTYTGTDISIYKNDSNTPSAIIYTGGIDAIGSFYVYMENLFENLIKSSLINNTSINYYYGTASVKEYYYHNSNDDIYIYQSYNGEVYLINILTSISKKAFDIDGNSIIPNGFYASGITSHTDSKSGYSYLYIAYYDTIKLVNNGYNYVNYIYKYAIKSDGILSLDSYITGGYNDEPFYNIGYMAGNMIITTSNDPNDFIIYYYEYSFNYSISRIMSVAF